MHLVGLIPAAGNAPLSSKNTSEYFLKMKVSQSTGFYACLLFLLALDGKQRISTSPAAASALPCPCTTSFSHLMWERGSRVVAFPQGEHLLSHSFLQRPLYTYNVYFCGCLQCKVLLPNPRDKNWEFIWTTRKGSSPFSIMCSIFRVLLSFQNTQTLCASEAEC